MPRSGRGHVVLAQIRNDRPRTLTMLAAVAAATAAFTVLTGAADTSKVEAKHTVAATGPSSYDILVRPRGTQTPIERASGEVRPGFVDGVFGGISTADYRTIRRIPGVAVAAPVAMVGYTLQDVFISLNIRHVVTTATRQLFEVSVTTTTDRGLSHIPSPPSYIYITHHPLHEPPNRGTLAQLDEPVTEGGPDGHRAAVCGGGQQSNYANPYVAAARSLDECFSTASASDPHPSALLIIPIPLLIEAIDPAAEARLDGLNRTVFQGRYLRSTDGVGSVAGTRVDNTPTFPVLVSSRNYLDDQFTVAIRRLAASAATAVLRRPLQNDDNAPRGSGALVKVRHVAMGTAYRDVIRQLRGQINRNVFTPVDGLWRVRPVTYASQPTSSTLRPNAVTNANRVWSSRFQSNGFVRVPADNRDVGYRRIQEHVASLDPVTGLPVPVAVGVFDPGRLEPFNALTRVPLGGFEPPQASPAGDRSSRLLHGRDLLPDSNLAGYLGQPPQLVTTLSALPALENSTAYSGNLDPGRPISAIRIRVAGDNVQNALGRARVNLVAQDIIERTGLQVDIVAGSSPSTRVTSLPAGRFGRPALDLREGWIDKGVALRILRAVDRKSLLLFVLVLVVCGLFVLNAAGAAVRARRRQLGILACVGWTPRQLFATVMSEQALVGLVAGVAGVTIALPVAAATSLHVTGVRVVLAVVVAVVLAMVAALAPAVAASRADPIEAIRPVASRFRASRPVRGTVGLALRNLLRSRTRSAIAVVGLAIGICSSVLLLAVTTSFNGQLAGDLLGQAVTVRVRGVDYAAVTVMLALGVFGVADVLYLNIRERSSELATLQATGWSRGQIARLITVEGLSLGFAGSLLGVAAGIALVTSFTTESAVAAVPLALAALATGTVLGAAAVAFPVQALPRRLAASLAEE